MAGNQRQKKSSSSFFSIFNFFASKKPRGVHHDRDASDGGGKVWHSDEDEGLWGWAKPGIDKDAEAFIAKCKQRVSESQLRQLDPAAKNA